MANINKNNITDVSKAIEPTGKEDTGSVDDKKRQWDRKLRKGDRSIIELLRLAHVSSTRGPRKCPNGNGPSPSYRYPHSM